MIRVQILSIRRISGLYRLLGIASRDEALTVFEIDKMPTTRYRHRHVRSLTFTNQTTQELFY